MADAQELESNIEEVLSTAWNERDGRVIPEYDDVALDDGAVKLEATFLYADLAASSRLCTEFPRLTAARIIKAYVYVASELIRAWSGKIRSFDGDRVMGVFAGSYMRSSAVECARRIDWAVEKVIMPLAREKFKSVRDGDFNVRHGIGIDCSMMHVVRGGVHGNNDLIWVGRAPCLAAKLSNIREYPYTVFISNAVHNRMDTALKGDPALWEKRGFNFAGNQETVYRTKFYTTP